MINHFKSKINEADVVIIADGYIGGVQMTLSHGNDFSIEITKSALVSEYKTEGNETILVIAEPETESLFSFKGEFEVLDMIVANSMGEIDSKLLPTEYSLKPAYPNPFNPVTIFDYTLPYESSVHFMVYDIRGRLVTELIGGIEPAGYHSIKWNASKFSSGMYFVNMVATDASNNSGQSFTKTQKVMLVK